MKDLTNYFYYYVLLFSFETIYKGSAKSHKVSKLCEQSSYGFRVRAANEAGYGPYSDVRIYKTGVQPPASVKGNEHIEL